MGCATKRVTAIPRPAGRPPWASPGADDLDRIEKPARRAFSGGQGLTEIRPSGLEPDAVQRFAGSRKISLLARDILSHRRDGPQHVSEFRAARIGLRRFGRQAQADAVAVVGRAAVRPGPRAPVARPRLGRGWIMITTDGKDIYRSL
jgi:hypothetical protein